jgi:ApaG protein
MATQVYTQTTNDIQVSACSYFIDTESDPEENQYVWAYKITIENKGNKVIQLTKRHWLITDGFGRLQEVHGTGVVGECPILKPGDVYEYTSGTPLSTPSGMMRGSYHMETPEGETFDVIIPTFSLDSPHQEISIN